MRVWVDGRWESYRLVYPVLLGGSSRQCKGASDGRTVIVTGIGRWLSHTHHDLHYLRPCMRVIQAALTDHTQADYWLGLRGAKPWDVLFCWARQQGVYIRGAALASQQAVRGPITSQEM